MRILIDTNVLLDFVAKREPYYEDAVGIFNKCVDGAVQGCIAAHSITNMFYILKE